MKKCFIIFAAVLFGFAAHADEYISRNTAVVRIMNKAAGKAQTVNLPVGRSVEFEKLEVLVRTCKQTAPYDPENFYMFAEIKKNDTKIFSGWMDKNEPGDNPLQDADYDLWLVKCE